VVIGGFGLALDLVVLRNHTAGAGAAMDWWGTGLSVLVVGVPFLLIERLAGDLHNPIGLAFLLAGLSLLGLFVVVERRSAGPLLDLHLFQSRAFTCGSIAAAFYLCVATFGYFLLPLYAQVVLGLSPFTAGLLLVPMSVALMASSQLVGRLAGRFSARLVSTAGLICTSTGALGMSLLGPTGSYPLLVGMVVLVGVGGGLFHPPNNSAVLSAVPPQNVGGANGFFTTAKNFGQAIGAALAAAVLGNGLGPSGAVEVLAQAPSASAGGAALGAYVQAQAFAFRVGAVLGLVGAVISALRGSEIQSAPPGAGGGGGEGDLGGIRAEPGTPADRGR
jgi:Na+/melibiose symporter-like transporter